MKTLFNLSGFIIALSLLWSYLDHTHPDVTLTLLFSLGIWGAIYLFIGE